MALGLERQQHWEARNGTRVLGGVTGAATVYIAREERSPGVWASGGLGGDGCGIELGAESSVEKMEVGDGRWGPAVSRRAEAAARERAGTQKLG